MRMTGTGASTLVMYLSAAIARITLDAVSEKIARDGPALAVHQDQAAFHVAGRESGQPAQCASGALQVVGITPKPNQPQRRHRTQIDADQTVEVGEVTQTPFLGW